MTFVDPLVSGDIDLTVVLIVIGKTIATFALLLVAVLFYIWFLRKVIADMQNRIGPDNAGPFGILQSLADGIKLFFKEQSIPRSADKYVFLIAPYLSILPAFLAFSIVPIGGKVSIAGHTTYLQLAELPIGVLWLLAMSGLGLYGVLLAGWSFSLAVVGVLIQSGTLSTRGIVTGQAWTGNWIHGLGQWYVRPAIVAFVIFLIAAIAETNHPPFDLVEAEQELVGGFHTEYTGIRFAIFFLAEFMNVITMSAIAVTLFLGGPSGPKLGFLDATSTINVWVMPVFWFMLKLLVLLYGTVLIRATLPRLRYDQLMDLGWKYMIEVAFLWLMVSGVVVIGRQEGWNLWIVVPAAAVGAVLVYLVLYASIAKPGELREQEQIR